MTLTNGCGLNLNPSIGSVELCSRYFLMCYRYVVEQTNLSPSPAYSFGIRHSAYLGNINELHAPASSSKKQFSTII